MDDFETDFGLTLREGEVTAPKGVWIELARAAGYGGDAEPAVPEIANLLSASTRQPHVAARLYASLGRMIQPEADAEEAEVLRKRASELIASLRPEVVTRALVSQSNLAERQAFLTYATTILSPAALHVLALAAGESYDRAVSPTLDTLLAKLQSRAEAEPGGEAESVLRSMVVHMVARWSFSRLDTSTIGYEHVYFQEVVEDKALPEITPEPERVVQLALETGAIGSALWSAISHLSDDEHLPGLLRMLKDAPAGSKAASMIAQQFANPQRLLQMLREDPIPFAAVDALIEPMQLGAADTLLNELITSGSRATRRELLERLAKLGPGIEPMVIMKLRDERWFVLRNMLHLLNEANAPTERLPLEIYQKHADTRVRREAMQLSFRDPVARDRAFATAFKDTDTAVLRSALKNARAGLPDAAVPVLAKRIFENDFPPEFRIPALQLLGRSKSLLALDVLLKFVSGGTTMLGKPKLAAKTPEMLTALRGLARTWRNERRASVLVTLAASSSDPNIANAAAATEKAEEPSE